METRAAKRRRLEEEEEEATRDRISDLPDVILHHILSFLSIKFMVQLGTLSKHWSHIWRSYPNLDFSKIKPTSWEFVHEVFRRRDTNSNVKGFRFNGLSTPQWLNQCMRDVTNHGVQELELNLHFPCEVPKVLLTNGTVKVLTLGNQYYPTIKAHALRMKSLSSLSLENVEFPLSYRSRKYKDDVFSSDRFPCLRSLHLKRCYGFRDMEINCTSLEELQLYGLQCLTSLLIFGTKIATISVQGCLKENKFGDNLVKISAPNVRDFSWYNNSVCETFSVERFLRPATFKVEFVSQSSNAGKLKSLANLLSAGANSENFHIKLLSNLKSAFDILPTYINIKNLTLRSNLMKEYILGTVFLLKTTPFVQTLTFIVDHWQNNAQNIWNMNRLDNANISEEEYWESQAGNLKQVLSHINTVKIEAKGDVRENMVTLVKFLLKHGVALQDMKLICPSNFLGNPSWEQKIGSKVVGFPKASSNVKISFVRIP